MSVHGSWQHTHTRTRTRQNSHTDVYLDHEVLDDPVKFRALVVQRLPALPDTLLTRAQAPEVGV